MSHVTLGVRDRGREKVSHVIVSGAGGRRSGKGEGVTCNGF